MSHRPISFPAHFRLSPVNMSKRILGPLQL
jgi:hypothetical protein